VPISNGSPHSAGQGGILPIVQRAAVALAVACGLGAVWLALTPFTASTPDAVHITTIHTDCSAPLSVIVNPPDQGPCIEPAQHRAYIALGLTGGAIALPVMLLATTNRRRSTEKTVRSDISAAV